MGEQLVDAAVLGSIYVLFALGMSLAWGVLGVLNMAHGAVLMFAAFGVYWLEKTTPISLPAAVGLGIAIGGMCGFVLEVAAFRPIRKAASDRDEGETQIVIASLGAATIFTALAAMATNDAPFSVATSFQASTLHFLGLAITSLQIIIIALGLGLSGLLALWLKRSRTGQAIRAIESDPETASLMAINERRLAALTVAASGALAGLAGVLLVVYLGGEDPQASSQLLTEAFAIIVIGGVGSVKGTVISAFVLALVETLVISNTSGSWEPAVSFAFIILVLLFKPQGLFTSSRTRVDRA